MEWNVFRISCNRNKVVVFNIFNHESFRESCKITAKKYFNDKDAFTKEIESHLMYFFWAKVEHEVLVSSLSNDLERKIDIYQQVMLNWDRFIDYVWENRDLLKEKEKK